MRRSLSILVLLFVLVGPEYCVSLPASAQGQIYTDTMDSAATGLLSVESQDPAVAFTYQNGQYLVLASTPSFEGEITSYVLVPDMASSLLTVDAAVGGHPDGKYVMAGCRAAGENDGYAFVVFPESGTVSLYREDAGGSVLLADTVVPNLVNSGNTTLQIGIDCSINIITGIVNDEPVLNAVDATYEFGMSYIGAGAGGDQTDGLTVGFDNLSITDKGILVLGDVPPTAEVVPTAVMEAISDPNLDPAETLADAFTISLNMPPAASGLGGDTEVEDGHVLTLPSGVQTASFYAELYFTTPAVPADATYSVGFCFWFVPPGRCTDIFIQDNGSGQATWGYGYDAPEGYRLYASGTLPAGAMDATPAAINFLSLTVYQGYAILSGDTYAADAIIPLQGTPLVGEVKALVGYGSSGDMPTLEPLLMSLSEFAVWDLSSGLVPVPSAADSSLLDRSIAIPTWRRDPMAAASRH